MGLGIEICGVVDLSLVFLGLRSLGIEFNFLGLRIEFNFVFVIYFVFWFKLSNITFF